MKHVLWLIGAGALVLVLLVVLIGFSPQDQEFVPSDDEAGFQSIVKPCASPDSAPRLPSRRSCKDRSTVRNAHYDPDCPEHWHIAPRPGWDLWQCMSSCEADLGRGEGYCQTLEEDEQDECSLDCLAAFRACQRDCMNTPPDTGEGESYCPEDYSATL